VSNTSNQQTDGMLLLLLLLLLTYDLYVSITITRITRQHC